MSASFRLPGAAPSIAAPGSSPSRRHHCPQGLPRKDFHFRAGRGFLVSGLRECSLVADADHEPSSSPEMICLDAFSYLHDSFILIVFVFSPFLTGQHRNRPENAPPRETLPKRGAKACEYITRELPHEGGSPLFSSGFLCYIEGNHMNDKGGAPYEINRKRVCKQKQSKK